METNFINEFQKPYSEKALDNYDKTFKQGKYAKDKKEGVIGPDKTDKKMGLRS
jgi:hypothetical protein